MKFHIGTKQLLRGLQMAANVTPTRTALVAATHLLMEIKAGRLLLTGTDTSHSIHYSSPIHAEKEGACLVPALRLIDIIKSLHAPTGEVSLETINHEMHLVTGDIAFTQTRKPRPLGRGWSLKAP